MAELIFKSPGVSSREIDLSAPSQGTRPTGVPAGVIGTANEGPAFIPVTVSSFSEFVNVFGPSDGEKFGPVAVSQWLKNAQACTYVRILGIGDGKKRNSATGVVNRAGFFVGDKSIQATGRLGDSPYANSGAGSVEGRTYFLGCFMSESAGSTIFSSAGMQKTTISSAASTKITYTGQPADGQQITIVSTDGTTKTYECDSGGAANGDIINTDKVAFVRGGNADTAFTNLIAAINHANGYTNSSRPRFKWQYSSYT